MTQRLGVIIPTYRRPRHLHRCLDALRRQTLPGSQIIVINDAPEALEMDVQEFGLDLRVVSSDEVGPTSARNLGLKALASDVACVGFLDDDSVPAADWCESCRMLFMEFPEVTAVLGRIGWRSDDCKGWLDKFWPRLRQKIYDSRDHCFTDAGFRNQIESCLSGNLPKKLPGVATHLSCNNAAIRREFIELNGPFDERFRTMSDREMAMRVLARGGLIAYHRSMYVEHDHDPSMVRALRRCFRAVPYQKLLAQLYEGLEFGDAATQRSVPFAMKLTLLERAYLVLHLTVQRIAIWTSSRPHAAPLASVERR